MWQGVLHKVMKNQEKQHKAIKRIFGILSYDTLWTNDDYYIDNKSNSNHQKVIQIKLDNCYNA
jgi:hypothetical protein